MRATNRLHPSRSASTLRLAMAALALGALVAAGCGGGTSTARTLTQRERDSTLGASALPGAGVVKRALKESDAAGARAATLDSQTESDAP